METSIGRLDGPRASGFAVRRLASLPSSERMGLTVLVDAQHWKLTSTQWH